MAALLFASGCQKAAPTPVNTKKPGAPSAQPKACDPWRNVTGYTAMFSEINSFAICDMTNCSGSSVTTVVNHNVLYDPATGSPFLFSSVQTITPADQNAVMNAALAWAIANKPTGYFVSAISYNDDILVSSPPPTWSGVDIVVTYRKCTGGGGGQG